MILFCMQELKLSLVTSSGLLLASKPEDVDETKQVLASGLISAILTFAKEVHDQELQSLSYFDRTVSFVLVHDFIIIVESKIDEKTFSERQLNRLLEQIKISSESLLEDRDPHLLSYGEAALILEHCLHDINNLQLFFVKNPLITAEPAQFVVNHTEKGWEVTDKVGKGSFIGSVAKMIDTNITKISATKNLQSFIVLLPEEKSAVLVILRTDGKSTNVGVLKFPRELDYSLFRLYPMLEEILYKKSSTQFQYDMLDVLDDIQQLEDPGIRFYRIDIEELSLAFLFKAIERNLEQVIYSIIVGNPVFVVGDRLSVRLVIDTLSIFLQHFSTDTREWVIVDEIIRDENLISESKLFGMSFSTYETLTNMNKITKKETIVDLETGKVDGEDESHYFLNILNENKNSDIEKTSVLIFQELRKLIDMVFIITSFSLNEEEKAKQKLRELVEYSPFPPSFTKKAIELAKKCNSLLSSLS